MKQTDSGIYSELKQLVDSKKRIDDKAARRIAQYLFGIEDTSIGSAKAYKLNPFCNSLKIGKHEIKTNRYAVRDESYIYSVKFGYDYDSNIIVYSEKIDVVKPNEHWLEAG